MGANDPYDLRRFLDAQDESYDRALAELQAGRKDSHWMWFVFPQIRGLGASSMAQYYAIQHTAEAQQYLAHPVLGARLRECAAALLGIEGKTANQILGTPDDLKLRSSMTLFARVDQDGTSIFRRVLDKYFQGQPDPRTLEILADVG